MKTKNAILAIQAILLIPQANQAPRVGPRTRDAFNQLASMDPESEWEGLKLPDIAHLGSQVDQPDRQSTSAVGLSLVKHFESCLKPVSGGFTAYDDGGGVLTIGWGHTGLQHKDGTVFRGRVITKEKADELLAYDMRQFEARVNNLVDVQLNQDQFDALVSFDFNTGGLTLGGGKHSTILRKLNAGDSSGAAGEFAKWNRDNGRVLPGLTRRRAAEQALFIGDHDRMRSFMS